MAGKLSARWQGQDVATLERSPFGRTEEGLADFRNAPLAPLRQIEGIALADADFSGADCSNLRLRAARFTNCKFDAANFSGVSEQGSAFDGCSFVRTDWRAGHIGADHSQFRRSVFDSLKLAKTNFYNARFEQCRFAGTWKGVDFNTSGFWGCRFAGRFQDIMVRGDYLYASERARRGKPRDTGLHDVSFADAELHWIGLAGGCVAEHVEMPHSGDAFLCDLARLLREEAALLDGIVFEMQRALKKYIDVIRPGPAREGLASQPLVIVSRYDLVSLSNEATGGDAYERLRARTAAADAALVH